MAGEDGREGKEERRVGPAPVGLAEMYTSQCTGKPSPQFLGARAASHCPALPAPRPPGRPLKRNPAPPRPRPRPRPASTAGAGLWQLLRAKVHPLVLLCPGVGRVRPRQVAVHPARGDHGGHPGRGVHRRQQAVACAGGKGGVGGVGGWGGWGGCPWPLVSASPAERRATSDCPQLQQLHYASAALHQRVTFAAKQLLHAPPPPPAAAPGV